MKTITNNQILFNSYLTLTGFPEARFMYLTQGDKTPLVFELKDRHGEIVELEETEGEVQIVNALTEEVKAIEKCTVENGRAEFIIDTILPVAEYEVYVKVGHFYFPSVIDSFSLMIVPAYDVVDIDVQDYQTINIVVEALEEEILPIIMGRAEDLVDAIISQNPDKFKGDKGDPLTWEDLTDEQRESLRGEAGTSLTFEGLDSAQQEAIRGFSAYQVAVNEGFEGTEDEWFETLKGEKGDTGDSAYEEALKNGFEGSEADWLESLNGLDGTVAYSDLDESQKADLRVPPKVYTRDEYNNLSSIDPNTLYFIEEV